MGKKSDKYIFKKSDNKFGEKIGQTSELDKSRTKWRTKNRINIKGENRTKKGERKIGQKFGDELRTKNRIKSRTEISHEKNRTKISDQTIGPKIEQKSRERK